MGDDLSEIPGYEELDLRAGSGIRLPRPRSFCGGRDYLGADGIVGTVRGEVGGGAEGR